MARRIAFALLLLLGLQELALRAVFPLPEVLNFDRLRYAHLGVVPDPAAPASLAHGSFSWASDPDGFEYVHRLNLYGFRDGEWTLAPRPGVTRIGLVGDSFVEGFSTDAASTLPATFARLAAQAGLSVEALNLGVGGAGLEAYARLLRDALPLLQPSTVILVLFANDVIPVRFDPAWLDDPLTPERSSQWQPRLAHVLRQRRLGRPVARRWHAAPFPFLPAVPDPRNPWSDGRIAGRYAFVAPEIARAIREGRFNPMLPGWLPWFARSLARPVDLTPHLSALASYARSHGTELLVVYLPTKSQVSDRYLEYQAAYAPPDSLRSLMGAEFQEQAAGLAHSCARLGVPFLDLTAALREGEARAGPLHWRYDDHMNADGYREAAQRVFEWWRSTTGDGAARTSTRHHRRRPGAPARRLTSHHRRAAAARQAAVRMPSPTTRAPVSPNRARTSPRGTSQRVDQSTPKSGSARLPIS